MMKFAYVTPIYQLSPPDMRTPIQYALTYPDRTEGVGRRMDWGQGVSLHFEPPAMQRSPALGLAYEVAERGGTLGAVFNAANEVPVEAFTPGNAPVGEIARLVELTFRAHRVQPVDSLDDLLGADRGAREVTRSHVRQAK